MNLLPIYGSTTFSFDIFIQQDAEGDSFTSSPVVIMSSCCWARILFIVFFDSSLQYQSPVALKLYLEFSLSDFSAKL